MKKHLALIIGLFCFATECFACSCDVPKPAVEFAYADYVFTGEVSSKNYASDSLTYTIIFDVTKHFKSGDSPTTLSFTLKSEGEISGEPTTSCDWNVEKNEKWLVYAYCNKGKLVFSYICSNSKPIGNKGIEKIEQRILENGNKLNLDNYIFSRLDGFYSQARPKANMDSILTSYQKNNYQDDVIYIIVDIDKKGNLEAANLRPKKFKDRPADKVIDSIFNLNKPQNFQIREPESRAEKDFLELVRNLKKWDKTYLPFSNKPIAYRMYLQFYPEKDTIKLFY